MNKNRLYYARDVIEKDYKINNSLNLSDILDDILSSNIIYADKTKVSREYIISMIEREYQLDKATAFHISTLVKYYFPRLFKD
jgi:hypothetical protein